VSRRPFDLTALQAAIGPTSQALDREGRVRLLGEAAKALLAGRLPEPEARLFLAGGLSAWLEGGGDLVRDFWKVAAPRGSHRTAAALHRDERVPEGEDVGSNDPNPHRDAK
jgi:hypothetical protein